MSDANIAEILKLPAEERMRLAEIIWASLPLTLPGCRSATRTAVIDERLAAC